MAENKDRPLESKEERQKTMDKMSVDTSEAETLREGESDGSGCLHNVQPAKEERQKEMDKGNA
jgi:hypothetical protein